MTITPYSSKAPFTAQQILTGTTWHVRRQPSQHKFSYPYRYWGLNLTALKAGNQLPNLGRIFSAKHQGAKKTILQQICFDDYLSSVELSEDDTPLPSSISKPSMQSKLDESVQALLHRLNTQFEALAGSQPEGEILALVVGRNLGMYFSPVNFYIGFDTHQSPSHLLAEVSNTPWDKRHYYGFLLAGASSSVSHAKDFHVSPFNPIDQHYRWQVDITSATPNADSQSNFEADCKTEPSHCLDIGIAIHVSDERGEVFAAGIKMSGIPMTKAAIKQTLRANPIMSITSMAQIYWHALKLFAIKRVPYIHYDETLRASKQSPASLAKNQKKSAVKNEKSGGKPNK